MPTKLFIGNLTEDTRSGDIRPLFEKYGKVVECDVLKNYGFVHMDDEKDALDAIDGLTGMELRGSEIVVQKSHGRRGGSRGGYRGRSSYYGGYRSYSSRDDYGSYSRYQSSDSYSRYSRSDYDDYSRSYDRKRPYPDPYDRHTPAYSSRTSSYSRSGSDYDRDRDRRRSGGSSSRRESSHSREYSRH